MTKRNRQRKTRIQLAFDLDSILKALENSFISKLSGYFKRLTNNLAKKINNIPLFVNSLIIEDKKDIAELKTLLQNYYKKIGKETIKQTNKEIQELSGKKSFIKIPDVNEGLRYRAEQLAIQKIKDFNKEIRDKILSSEGSLKDKKALLSTLKKAQNSYINKHVTIVSRMESVTHANNQRLEAFKKSTIVTAVQFLAVLDNRTTPICTSRHNMVIKLDDPLLPNFKPPCHFGCRSLLSPVTIYDKLEPTNLKFLEDVPNKDFGKFKDKKEVLANELNEFGYLNEKNKVFWDKVNKGLKGNDLKLSSDELSDITKTYEKEILKLSKGKEIGLFINEYGNIISSKTGTSKRLEFDSKYNNLYQTAYIFTHNHPSGLLFSQDDIISAHSLEIPLLRVVTEKRIYSLKNIYKNDLNTLLEKYKEFTLISEANVFNILKKENKIDKISNKEFSVLVNRDLWKALSKHSEFNLIYKELEL